MENGELRMNEVIKVLMERKSVRVFENTEIPGDIKDAILDAAMRAPTAGNSMMYSIIDITDQQVKDTLAKTCDNQPFIAQAPLVLVFCSDLRRLMQKYKQAGCEDIPTPELSDLILATNDAVIAAHASCVAAESFGIGSCYIGDIIESFEIHKELLNLPEQVAPVSMLVFGYPTEQQKNRPQPTRYPKDMIIFENTYKDLTEDQLNEYMTDDRAVAFFNRKYASEFSREMARSTKEIFKNWNKN